MCTPNSLSSVHAYSPILLLDTHTYMQVCIHHGVHSHIGCLIAILRHNAYMYEQIRKGFEGRKYLYECTPFGYVNLWVSACTQLFKIWSYWVLASLLDANLCINKYINILYYTQNKRRVVIALVSPISACNSPLMRVVLHWAHWLPYKK